ncbi:MAG TPA: hypothetical protein VN345_16855 [Blastocatellia bacterium]|jgi:hypothetical protein|nr:hypothetical protein [Blastocatellia bacterium]
MKKIDDVRDACEPTSDEEWVNLWLRLRFYLGRRFFWLARRGWDLDEIASQVIVDVKLGKRRWPPVDPDGRVKTEVQLFTFLCNVARSIVSHMWDLEKRKISIDGAWANDPEDPNPKSFETLLSESGTPLLAFHPDDTEKMANYNRLTGKMIELVANDGLLVRMIELWRADPALKPRDLAEILRVRIEEVQAAQKRLRRRVKSIKDEFTCG